MYMPCLRYWISDASLYREQKAPWSQWTLRWGSMDILDIEDWASATTITASVTNGVENASYQLELRQFLPKHGDMTYQTWTDHLGAPKYYPIPLYAIANMRSAATELRRYVNSNIANYLTGFVGRSDPLFWSTFYWAFRWSQDAAVSVGVQCVL